MAQADFLTQANLDNFKALYPQDTRLQSLTLSELMANTQDVTPQAALQAPVTTFALILPPAVSCAIAVGTVVIDALCLVAGAVALRNTIVKSGAQAVGSVVAPIMSKIEAIIAKMAAPNATPVDIATGLGRILLEIKDASLFGAVWDAFKQQLTWYYAVLYGVIALATIVALFATEGLAIIAEIVLLLTSFVTMVIDIAAAVSTCAVVVTALTAHAPPAPPAPGNPYVTEPHGAFVTSGGYYLTFTGGGGLSAGNAVLNTNALVLTGNTEFTLRPIDPDNYSFAIQFLNVADTYLTATNGGGMKCDDPSTCPVQTYSQTLGPNETVALVQQQNGTFAICLPNGNYVSVGNLVSPAGGPVTVATVPSTATFGANEIFTFKKVVPAG